MKHGIGKKLVGVALIACVLILTLALVACNLLEEQLRAEYKGGDIPVGGEIDRSQLFVEVYGLTGSSRLGDDEYELSGFDSSVPGTKKVSATYKNGDKTLTAEFTVNVTSQSEEPVVTLQSISATYNGGDVVVGGTLDNGAITVTAKYSDGSSKEVDGWTTTGFDSASEGVKTVTVTYVEGGITQKCTFTVNVASQGEEPAVTLQSISATYNGGDVVVNSQPAKADFVVTAFYDDGSSKSVSDFTLEFDSSQAGQKPCKVIYSENGVERTATVNITVVEAAQPGAPAEGKYDANVIKNENLSIHFLMLGNKYTGDSVYIKAGETDILIDAGSRYGSASTIYNYVSQYCTDGKLEYVVATHAHQDHIEGFVNGSGNGGGVLDRFEVDTIITYALKKTTSKISGYFTDKLNALKQQGVNVYTANECVNNTNNAQKEYALADGITMEILDQKYYHQKGSEENNYSVCLMIKQGENNYLFTGDLEGEGEESLVQLNPDLPKVKLWKGGHHGSVTSGHETLLRKIQPETVCICTCMGTTEYTTGKNVFPAQEFVDRVAQYTDRVYCTTDGTKYSSSDACIPANGNIVFACTNGQITMYFSNNNLKLKDTDWFKQNRTMPDAWKNS